MAERLRKLRATDVLYRAVTPEQYNPDDGSLYATAFEDPGRDPRTGRPSHTLSFSVSAAAGPTSALRAISRRGQVRRDCKTGAEAAPPRAMFDAQYRVAALPARYVIEACARREAAVWIERDAEGNEYEVNGHLELVRGFELADLWAKRSRVLAEEETFKD
jgi:hypothetical protein